MIALLVYVEMSLMSIMDKTIFYYKCKICHLKCVSFRGGELSKNLNSALDRSFVDNHVVCTLHHASDIYSFKRGRKITKQSIMIIS